MKRAISQFLHKEMASSFPINGYRDYMGAVLFVRGFRGGSLANTILWPNGRDGEIGTSMPFPFITTSP